MNFDRPTHEEIATAARLILENLGACAKGDELPSRLQHIANCKPSREEELYSEAKRLYLENLRLRNEATVAKAAQVPTIPFTYTETPAMKAFGDRGEDKAC